MLSLGTPQARVSSAFLANPPPRWQQEGIPSVAHPTRVARLLRRPRASPGKAYAASRRVLDGRSPATATHYLRTGCRVLPPTAICVLAIRT